MNAAPRATASGGHAHRDRDLRPRRLRPPRRGVPTAGRDRTGIEYSDFQTEPAISFLDQVSRELKAPAPRQRGLWEDVLLERCPYSYAQIAGTESAAFTARIHRFVVLPENPL